MAAKCVGESLVDAEEVYLKVAAWGAIFNKILMKESVALPVLTDAEAFGMNILFQDTLKDVELLAYGKHVWSEMETTNGQRGGEHRMTESEIIAAEEIESKKGGNGHEGK